ncbi:TRAP transporter small permease subunit [Ponticaulis sp.]|uniref:TRAP transporter small permease subunit n=1 Tax=Ponticaulis sp. TaxID=2020902 RepID=UPI000B7200EA|nr:TRAP transporter small permease subunit [Ponticaulis sp.]MAI89659.1 TRAP transporter permease DctQ [Ponticaulis sp.]OUY00679.1 MAG: TRAP transporter permease DctQ [Hyphomonadaceae bacterium TMED5]|tara:strand:- start:132119 stop:132784 length:666 start_codon:yes stop_codon:yes gene_type:complete
MDPQIFITLGGWLGWLGIILLPLFILPLITLIIPAVIGSYSEQLVQLIQKITHGALMVCMVATLALLALQLLVVIAGYAFGLSWTWLSEAVMYAFACMFMIGAAVALRDNAHVRVDILRPRFGPHGRDWIELAGLYLFLFPICIRILTTGDQGLTRAWMIFEGSRESDGLPLMFLFKTLVPVFAVLMLSQGLAEALKAALRLTGLRPDIEHTQSGGDTYGA